jgi:circadian clock protein KaiC
MEWGLSSLDNGEAHSAPGIGADSPRVTVSTGVRGLDEVIDGGLTAHRSYLVRGGPGSGKTTLSLQFLLAGVAAGESVLYVSLTSPEAEVRADAAGTGLALDAVTVLDLSPASASLADGDVDELLIADDARRPSMVHSILTTAAEQRPRRVVVDSMTHLRERAEDAEEFRRHTVALIRALTGLPATVMFTSESGPRNPDDDLQFLADGVIAFEANGRRPQLTVSKLRGTAFRRGAHSMRIASGGLRVFPRLEPEWHAPPAGHDMSAADDGVARRSFEQLAFGVPELDEMLHGGLARATVTLLSGPSGVGKSTLGGQFVKEAAGRGERAVALLLDESAATFLHRCESLGMPVRRMIERGTLVLRPVESSAYSPDEVAEMVRVEVEAHHASVVMLDSISSFRMTVSAADELSTHLHALSQYLRRWGVTGLLIDEVPALTGAFQISEHQVSYLADTVVFLRYVELRGGLRKTVGVLKKRTGQFDSDLRELSFTPYGIEVGEPLRHLRGILSGIPTAASPSADQDAN